MFSTKVPLYFGCRRNEQIIGMRQYLGKQPGVVTVSGDDPKRFAAAMVEYTKEKVGGVLLCRESGVILLTWGGPMFGGGGGSFCELEVER